MLEQGPTVRKSTDRGYPCSANKILAWPNITACSRAWRHALAPDQLIKAPIPGALCGHAQEDETEQDGRFTMVLNWPLAIWRMKLTDDKNQTEKRFR